MQAIADVWIFRKANLLNFLLRLQWTSQCLMLILWDGLRNILMQSANREYHKYAPFIFPPSHISWAGKYFSIRLHSFKIFILLFRVYEYNWLKCKLPFFFKFSKHVMIIRIIINYSQAWHLFLSYLGKVKHENLPSEVVVGNTQIVAPIDRWDSCGLSGLRSFFPLHRLSRLTMFIIASFLVTWIGHFSSVYFFLSEWGIFFRHFIECKIMCFIWYHPYITFCRNAYTLSLIHVILIKIIRSFQHRPLIAYELALQMQTPSIYITIRISYTTDIDWLLHGIFTFLLYSCERKSSQKRSIYDKTNMFTIFLKHDTIHIDSHMHCHVKERHREMGLQLHACNYNAT